VLEHKIPITTTFETLFCVNHTAPMTQQPNAGLGYLVGDVFRSHMPIPITERSKAWVCGRSLAGVAGSNSAGDMDV
jgi:hypothetical protein